VNGEVHYYCLKRKLVGPQVRRRRLRRQWRRINNDNHNFLHRGLAPGVPTSPIIFWLEDTVYGMECVLFFEASPIHYFLTWKTKKKGRNNKNTPSRSSKVSRCLIPWLNSGRTTCCFWDEGFVHFGKNAVHTLKRRDSRLCDGRCRLQRKNGLGDLIWRSDNRGEGKRWGKERQRECVYGWCVA
jgi:hypothetical protein